MVTLNTAPYQGQVIVEFFGGAGFGGLWIAFIGWFLLQAAGESYVEAGLARVLGGVTVRDVMSGNCPVVDGHENIQNFVDEELLRTGDRCFVVLEGSGLAGLVPPHEAKTVDRARWLYTTVFDIMQPVKDLHTVQPRCCRWPSYSSSSPPRPRPVWSSRDYCRRRPSFSLGRTQSRQVASVANLALSLRAGVDRMVFPVPAPQRALICQFELALGPLQSSATVIRRWVGSAAVLRGPAPGTVGLYQINFQLAGTSPGRIGVYVSIAGPGSSTNLVPVVVR